MIMQNYTLNATDGCVEIYHQQLNDDDNVLDTLCFKLSV